MEIDRLHDDDVTAAMDRRGAETDGRDAGSLDGGAAEGFDARSEPAEPRQRLAAHETRDRATYYTELRAEVEAEYRAAGERGDSDSASDTSPAGETFDEAHPRLAERWREHVEKWPSGHADDRSRAELDEPGRAAVLHGCELIRETEKDVVTPAMLRVEADNPDCRLVGLEHCRKGQDRIREKVAEALDEQPDISLEEALANVKDTIRYTLQYKEGRYTDGVLADTARLKAQGFELVELRSIWTNEEYKGINSRWRVPGNGQLFEVQFHTRMSFEAKQFTHSAYERIRDTATTHAEMRELRSFQRAVCATIPVPQRAADIPDYL